MLKTALFVLSTSYVAWYYQQFETRAVYPFDATYATPTDAGVPSLVEEKLVTDDGETLVIWHAEAAPGKPTVLYFSGNAGGLKERASRFQTLITGGFGLIAPAYRGSSGSTGTPTEELLLRDARNIAARETTKEFVLYGESLGTAIAIRLAAEGNGTRVALEAPFTSIPALVMVQHPSENLDHLITQRWESDQHISRVTQPLLVIHGDRDHLVPFVMGEEIFDTASSAHKSLLRIEGAGHSELWAEPMLSDLFAFFTAQ